MLILATTGRDAVVLGRTLSAASIRAVCCSTPEELCERLAEGAGAAILAEESLSIATRRALADALGPEPGWSELPLIVMAIPGTSLGPGQALLEDVKGAASAILLQRPVHTVALLSVVRAALRSRSRQYQIRDELVRRGRAELAVRKSERRLRELNENLEQRVAERTEELENRAQQLRRLAHELTRAEQRERKKLAQTLHDGLQQMLVAIKMQLATSSQEAPFAAAERIDQLLDQTLSITQSLAYQLSPPILHELELAGALEWLARWFAENQRFAVDLKVEGELPRLEEGTKLFLYDAVRELLLNSVKHSGARAVSLRLRADPFRWIRVEVRDEGAGFDTARLSSPDHKGIGLFSVRERLSALGGNLEVESSPGAGARFVLNLPLTKAEIPLDEPEPVVASGLPTELPRGPTTGGVRVLVVDDHRIFREGLVSMLRRQDEFEFIGEAADGFEAVSKTDQLQPDVVVMDINMPRLDGVEATRRIKREHPQVQIIGLSMHQDPERAEAMLQAGASVYLRKVDAAKTLFETIRALPVLSRASTPASG